MKDIEIRVHKLPILRLERDRLFPLGIPPERLAHVDVSILEMPDPIGGVKVEGRFEIPVVQLFQEISRVREKGFAPRVTCVEERKRSLDQSGL